MDVFQLREQIVSDYGAYVRSFLRIGDEGIHAYAQDELGKGRLWPDPLVQLNPSFHAAATADELVARGFLHPECGRIFRREKQERGFDGPPLRFHQHQQDAIAVARTGRSYVLTTGTGSGKSLAYFVPIVDHVLRTGSRKGIKALVIYPTNALCNSQLGELRKFLVDGYGEGREPVTFARYTGQESQGERDRIAANPPDILLTNYVMAELILTRFEHADKKIVEAAQGLAFLVLDELHTYRGRQGADVAMLVRRIRERLGAPTMRCVGTSATIAGRGTREERHAAVARVGSRLFGDEVRPDHVIGETLQPLVARVPPTAEELRASLAAPPAYPPDYATLVAHPLAAWTETAFGVQRDEQGRLERKPPVTLQRAAEKLGACAGVPSDVCRAHLQAMLLAGYQATHPETGRRLFAFRLHQFISRGDTVYASLERPGQRHLAMEGQVFVPGSRERRLYPLAFCRECGQEYSVVARRPDDALEARRLSDLDPEHGRPGYLFPDPGDAWSPEPYEDRLPEDWLVARADGTVAVASGYKKYLPEKVYASPDGRLSPVPAAGTLPVWFVPYPLRFCLNCGVTYAGRIGEFTKLAELATEGRSTATTVLSLSVVRALRDAGARELPPEARKLLSFTDNRQDASLQAGHLNDFVQVTQLRGALAAAVAAAGPSGLGHDEIAQAVTEALGLDFTEYASNPHLSSTVIGAAAAGA